MGLGVFRFFLAAFVAYSHFPGDTLRVQTPNLAVSAVIAFYFISGYLMRVSYERFHAKEPRPIRAFYVDRVVRLFPCFLIVFFVSLALAKIHWIDVPEIAALSLKDTLFELTIFAQNAGLVTHYFTIAVIPPAWSVGVELQWYLLVPFVFLLPSRLRWTLTFGFLTLQMLAFMPTVTGIGGTVCDYIKIDWLSCNLVSDMFGYRMFLFAGGVFMLGDLVACHRGDSKVCQTILIVSSSMFAFLYFVYNADSGDFFATQMSTEVSIGMVVFIPLGFACLQRPSTRGANIFDWACGKLAYPVFLSHFLAYWIVDAHIGNFTFDPPRSNIAEYFVVTIIIAGGLAFVQERIDLYRYKLRGFTSSSPSKTEAISPSPL